MKRMCSCEGIRFGSPYGEDNLCVVHSLWYGFLANLAVGAQPWAQCSPAQARFDIRDRLRRLQAWTAVASSSLCARPAICAKVPAAESYATHDFRRGHAQVRSCTMREVKQSSYRLQDMLERGATLSQILAAGQWRSSAFIRYLKEAELEQGVALEVAIHSDDEEWID